jgi:hypothetical protein
MTDATTPRLRPTRYGVWTRVSVSPQHAVEIEKLGYGASALSAVAPSADTFAVLAGSGLVQGVEAGAVAALAQ